MGGLGSFRGDGLFRNGNWNWELLWGDATASDPAINLLFEGGNS